ncbi:hypothetical protein [Mesorhizobium sp.]|uniref:hypothetical protein n=1 Tax=Mesorhizobium sp. TaxID=1871066 RepID=UPI0025E82C1F|nr:hypothetical protein [Mesorhizobium sp.]
MNLVTKTALAVFVASIGFGPVSSFAQDASCSCATYQGPANPVGGCGLDVPANSSLDISRAENSICLNLVGFEQTAAIQLSGGGGGFGPPEAIFDGVLLTSGVLSATQDDDSASAADGEATAFDAMVVDLPGLN